MIKEWIELPFFQSQEFKNILRQLKEEKGVVLPPREDILNAFAFTPFNEVKVVIIGQDPYHQASPQYAHGLAFSVRPGTKPLPKSLINIFHELKRDTDITRTNGDLSDWAKQGVLLLNTSLTVRQGQAGSHSTKGWKELVYEAVTTIVREKKNCVFILWGRHAQSFEPLIDQSKHFIIKSAHPSPLSASRGFFGSKPFSRTNEYLEAHGKEPIKW